MTYDIDSAAPSTPSEFIHRLRDLRLWAGQPSLRRLQDLGGRQRAAGGDEVDALPRSTVSATLRGDRLPRLDFIRAFVGACLRCREVDDVDTITERWLSAWHRLSALSSLSAPSAPSTLDTPERSTGPVPPRQLPVDAGGFLGRDPEFGELDRAGRQVLVITGPAGVGKSALAVQWSRRAADRFPHGQLYLDLAGPSGHRAQPDDLLRTLLRGLGSDDPGAYLDRVHLYRSIVADLRLLVLLDNAVDVAQVRPLLAAGSGCVTVVTAQDAMSGLLVREGAHRLVLDRLDPASAREVLTAVLGADRVRGAESAVAELAELCRFLPLNLRVAAVLLADRPQLRIRDYVAGLRMAGSMRAETLGNASARTRQLPDPRTPSSPWN